MKFGSYILIRKNSKFPFLKFSKFMYLNLKIIHTITLNGSGQLTLILEPIITKLKSNSYYT